MLFKHNAGRFASNRDKAILEKLNASVQGCQGQEIVIVGIGPIGNLGLNAFISMLKLHFGTRRPCGSFTKTLPATINLTVIPADSNFYIRQAADLWGDDDLGRYVDGGGNLLSDDCLEGHTKVDVLQVAEHLGHRFYLLRKTNGLGGRNDYILLIWRKKDKFKVAYVPAEDPAAAERTIEAFGVTMLGGNEK